jgi:hypothetical protein
MWSSELLLKRGRSDSKYFNRANYFSKDRIDVYHIRMHGFKILQKIVILKIYTAVNGRRLLLYLTYASSDRLNLNSYCGIFILWIIPDGDLDATLKRLRVP